MQLHQLDARIGRMLEELTRLSVRASIPVEGITVAQKGSQERIPFANGGQWSLQDEGDWWDFFCSVTVPDTFLGRVVLKVRTGREKEWEAVNPQFIVRVNGKIEQAFDTKHTVLTLQQNATPGVSYAIELNGYSSQQSAGDNPAPILKLTLEDLHEPLIQLIYDLSMPYQAALLLPEGNRDRETTLETIAQALDMLDLRAPYSEAFNVAIDQTRDFFAQAYYQARAALPPIAIAQSVGHTHIDVAWLWDLYQTRYKAVRSFATVLKLLEQYPEYHFMSSQAALYNMVKEDEPELYARIQEAVREGRWEVEGGMWVEADCNLASGESLVRQFLVGQAFFMREFGKKSRILWLPDVFGYSAALPQIMRKCGIDYFMTTKLSWSEFNLSPYDTFLWEGIDGSEVLTHFSPARDYEEEDKSGHDGLPYYTTYNAMITPRQISGGWQRFQQKGLDDHFLVCYGYGDGGGGPTDWMLENARRLATPLPATPVVRQSHARPFFEALETRVLGDPLLPKWVGELYLEYHRGTYTAMARNKRSNRKTELQLREVELWRAMANRLCGLPYPSQELLSIWQDVLTLQFHDILPGSSIQKVYDDSKVMYESIRLQLDGLLHEALSTLSKNTPGDVQAYNSLSYERHDIIWFDAPDTVTGLRNDNGDLFPVQHVEGRACAYVRNLRPMTSTPLWYVYDATDTDGCVRMDQTGFETPAFLGTFDASMRIVSLMDKRTGRQVAKSGQALNRIVCYENKPHNYDAWDMNIYYSRKHWEVDTVERVEVIACGAVLAKLRIQYRYMQSTITQDVIVYHDIDRIDFETEVDWREVQYMLKAHFPVDVFYHEATYDIQYGNIQRPTHRNTSWDIARFEVCAHKWADVSEDGYGVSLLNDCKYGHSIDSDSMALTLLKSSTHPNPTADQEIHTFTYALMPHAEDWRAGGTVDMAYRLNIPVLVTQQPAAAAQVGYTPFVSVSAPNLLIESVKQAEDGDGVIVRLYECFGRRTHATLSIGCEPSSVDACDMLENTLHGVVHRNGQVELTINPYEIATYRIR